VRKQLVQPGCQKTLTGSSAEVGVSIMEIWLALESERFNVELHLERSRHDVEHRRTLCEQERISWG
jgi:hypothetical protein